MSVPTSTDDTATGERLEFAVDAEQCIACMACVNIFPSIFRLEGGKPAAYASQPAAIVLSTRVVQSCPVGAIRRVTPMPEPVKPGSIVFEPVPGWEAEWEKGKLTPEDLPERERRYGRLLQVRKLASCYLLRIELPRGLPVHEAVEMYGMLRRTPEYDCSLHRLGTNAFSVRARLVDAKLRHLTGKLNSFPIGFKVDYSFAEPIGAAYLRTDLESVQVYAFPEGTADPLAKLAETIREQLAGD